MHWSSTEMKPGLHTHRRVRSMYCYVCSGPQGEDKSMHKPVGVNERGGGQTQLFE